MLSNLTNLFRQFGKKFFGEWRRTSLLVIAGLYVASVAMPQGLGGAISAEDGNLSSVTITDSSGRDIDSFTITEGNTKQLSFTAKTDTGKVLSESEVNASWSIDGRYLSENVGTVSADGTFTAGSKADFYSGAIKLLVSYNGTNLLDAVSVTVNESTDDGGDDGDDGNDGGDNDDGNDDDDNNNTQEKLDSVTITDSQGRDIDSFTITEDNSKSLDFIAQTDQGRNLTTGDGLSLSWSIDGRYLSKNVGSVSQSGLFTAGGKAGFYSGAIKLLASWNGTNLLDAVSVTVNEKDTAPERELDSFKITDSNGRDIDSFTITSGDTKNLSWKAFDQNGNRLTSSNGVSVSWNTDAGSITSSGRFTAGNSDGFFDRGIKATATYEGSSLADAVSVTVNQEVKFNDLEIDPKSAFLRVGETQQFTARATDQNGNEVDADLTWSVIGPGQINNSGRYSATQKGQATVRVTGKFENTIRHDSATVTVVEKKDERQLDRVELDPSSATITEGDEVHFDATAFDESGDVLNLSAVHWNWSHTGTGDLVSGVNDAKLVNTDPGSATVKVTVSYKSRTRSDISHVTVNQDDPDELLHRVEIFPSSARILEDESQDFDARTYDQFGDRIFGADLSWSVISGVGFINQNGRYSSNDDGNAIVRVRAERNGRIATDTASVKVVEIDHQERRLDRVRITPGSKTLRPHQRFDFDAIAYDQFGDDFANHQIDFDWRVLHGAGTINQNGLFRASGATGTSTIQVKAHRQGRVVADAAKVRVKSFKDDDQKNAFISANFQGRVQGGGLPQERSILVYEFTLKNTGSKSLHNTRANIPLPEYTNFLQASSPDHGPTFDGRNIKWSVGTLSVGEKERMTLKLIIENNLPGGSTVIQPEAFVTAEEISGFISKANPITVVKGAVKGDTQKPLPSTGPNAWQFWLMLSGLLAAIGATVIYIWKREKERELV